MPLPRHDPSYCFIHPWTTLPLPPYPTQAEFLGGSSLALCIGSAVLVAPLEELPKPTLANLLGALALDKALIAMRASGAGAGDGVLSAPAAAQQLLGSTVAVNPAALAAARVLHPEEIAALSDPFGGAPRPIDCRLELEEPTEPGQWLVEAKEVTWKVTDESADAAIAAEERRVWQEVQQPAAAALGSDAAMQQLLEPLLQLRRSSGYELSPRLVAKLVMLAAGALVWGRVCWACCAWSAVHGLLGHACTAYVRWMAAAAVPRHPCLPSDAAIPAAYALHNGPGL